MLIAEIIARPEVRSKRVLNLSGDGVANCAAFLDEVELKVNVAQSADEGTTTSQPLPSDLVLLKEVNLSRDAALPTRQPILCNFLSHVANLKKLTLSHCEIENIDPICKSCRNVEHVDLSFNTIRFLPDRIANLWTFLVDFNLTQNHISSIDEIMKLQNCLRLKKLKLDGNAVCFEADYQTIVITSLQQLFELDNLTRFFFYNRSQKMKKNQKKP